MSPLYSAESAAGRAVRALGGSPVVEPSGPGFRFRVSYDFLLWHGRQVFKYGPPVKAG